jgi:hypothetical protein
MDNLDVLKHKFGISQLEMVLIEDAINSKIQNILRLKDKFNILQNILTDNKNNLIRIGVIDEYKN